MATLKSKPTSDQLRLARKGGFKGKRPKKPKAGATLNAMENWVSRYNDWVSKVHGGIKNIKEKEKSKSKRETLKRQIGQR